jgi:hypothetical protein
LLDSWVADFSARDEAYFAATSNGWTCDSLGLQWLQKVLGALCSDLLSKVERGLAPGLELGINCVPVLPLPLCTHSVQRRTHIPRLQVLCGCKEDNSLEVSVL